MIQSKTGLRKIMLAKREAMPLSIRQDQDQLLFEQILNLPSLYHAHVFLLTLSFRGECDTWQLAQWMIRNKGFVVLPRVDQETLTLKLHRVSNLVDDLVRGFQGIFEPHINCPAVAANDIDWVLLPGLAFDKTGTRLGYGGGYFDRLLLSIPRTAYRVAMGYKFQLIKNVPYESHDQKIDTLVLPNGPFQVPHLLTGF